MRIREVEPLLHILIPFPPPPPHLMSPFLLPFPQNRTQPLQPFRQIPLPADLVRLPSPLLQVLESAGSSGPLVAYRTQTATELHFAGLEIVQRRFVVPSQSPPRCPLQTDNQVAGRSADFDDLFQA